MNFSIRDLLLVTVIVALATGWWLNFSFLNGKVKEQEEQILELRQRASEWEGIRLKLKKLPLKIALPNSSAPAPKLPKQ